MSNLSGISDYLNLAEVKESVREGADTVKRLMKEPSGLTKTEMSLLLAVFLLAGVIIGFIWAPIKRGLIIAGNDVITGEDEKENKGENA